MKKKRVFYLSAAIVFACTSIFLFAHIVANSYLKNHPSKNEVIVRCQVVANNFVATVSNGQIQPSTIYAKPCDTLTIINKDPVVRQIAFGPHDQHISYDGVTETALDKDESFTITLNQKGRYNFHDHFQPSTLADFQVN